MNFLFTVALAILISGPAAHAMSIRSWVGDREVEFRLSVKGNKVLLQTESNELARPPVVLNEANRKYFVDALKKACNRTEFEVNTQRYQIEINREENGRKVRCIYGFNSTSPKAAIARNALDVLSIAVNTAEERSPAAK